MSRGADGQPERAAGTVQDITRWKRNELALATGLSAIIATLECDRASILLLDEFGVMRFVRSIDLSPSYRATTEGHSPWRPGEGPYTPLEVADVASADLAPPLREGIEGEEIGALLFIPLVLDDRLIGKLTAYVRPAARRGPRRALGDDVDRAPAVVRRRAQARRPAEGPGGQESCPVRPRGRDPGGPFAGSPPSASPGAAEGTPPPVEHASLGRCEDRAARNTALAIEMSELRSERDRALAMSVGLRQALHTARNDANRCMVEGMRLRRELARLRGEPAAL